MNRINVPRLDKGVILHSPSPTKKATAPSSPKASNSPHKGSLYRVISNFERSSYSFYVDEILEVIGVSKFARSLHLTVVFRSQNTDAKKILEMSPDVLAHLVRIA